MMKFCQNGNQDALQMLDGLKNHQAVQKMKCYIQHGNVSTYEHCENVAELSYRLNRRFHLHADEKALLTGAMLHDFYLYDWHEHDRSHALHGFRHPERAVRNAVHYFHIGAKEQQIIRSHMWPLTLTCFPACREAWIVCLADKCCAVAETFAGKSPVDRHSRQSG